MLEETLKEQLRNIFAGLEAKYIFDITVSSLYENRKELLELLQDVADCSERILAYGLGEFPMGMNLPLYSWLF